MSPRPSDYARLPTERPNPRARGLDRRPVLELVRLLNAEDALVAAAVGRQARSIAQGVELIRRAIRAGGGVVFIGAGTSGRLGVLEAAECPPTFNTTPRQVRAVMAGGKFAVFRSKEGAEDDAGAGARAMDAVGSSDVVVGIAASGVTPFVRGALERAKRNGCPTILVTSNARPKGSPARVIIAPRVGPEVLAGSTRLKCGTAAKLVLNTLTTAAMIGLGKVYDHWMVDLLPSSRKLRLRGERIVAQLGRVEPARARRLLVSTKGKVKEAVVMARLGGDAAGARRRLKLAAGSLRHALGEK